MGTITYFPTLESNNVKVNKGINNEIIIIKKDSIMINGIEYYELSDEEFISMIEKNTTQESRERFIREVFEIIKDECSRDLDILRIFKSVFGKRR